MLVQFDIFQKPGGETYKVSDSAQFTQRSVSRTGIHPVQVTDCFAECFTNVFHHFYRLQSQSLKIREKRPTKLKSFTIDKKVSLSCQRKYTKNKNPEYYFGTLSINLPLRVRRYTIVLLFDQLSIKTNNVGTCKSIWNLSDQKYFQRTHYILK